MDLIGDERAVCVGTTVTEELPRVAYFTNLVEIEISNDQCVFIARRLRHKLSARIAEVTLTIKLADVPRLFMPDAIDRADEVAIRNRMRRLFQTPQIL